MNSLQENTPKYPSESTVLTALKRLNDHMNTTPTEPKAERTAEVAHTPGPWTIRRGGGHKSPSIVGSGSIHTNGFLRNSAGISSASFSDEVCEIRHSLELPGPLANARLIAAAPELLLELTKTNLFLVHVVSALPLPGLESSPVRDLLQGHIDLNKAAIAKAEYKSAQVMLGNRF